MKEYMIQYYTSEKQGAGAGIALGVIFIAVALWLWRSAAAASMQQGLAYTLSAVGMLMIIVTSIVVVYNNRRIRQTQEMAAISNADLQRSEVRRMEKVMATSYIGGLVGFSVSIAAGMVLRLLMQKPFTKGVGVGLLLFGLLGLGAELLSMKRNRRYLEEIRQLKF